MVLSSFPLGKKSSVSNAVFVPYHKRSDIKLMIDFYVGKDYSAMKKLAKKIIWE